MAIQPIIGITMTMNDVLVQEGVWYSFVRQQYGHAIRRAGGRPIYLDPTIDATAAAELCDGIVISGGQDIDPSYYNEKQEYDGIIESHKRVDWEYELISEMEQRKKPILGICYGSQLLNVYFGGTLYQDIDQQLNGGVKHGSTHDEAIHDVTFERDFFGFRNGDREAVAARHHQGVKDIAPGFSVVARADDGSIEAIVGERKFGVQWHSEADESSTKIYGHFVEVCRAESSNAV